MGPAWSSREGWGMTGLPSPFPHLCSFSPLPGLDVWLFLRTVCLYAVLMAHAFLNLLQTPGRGGRTLSLDKDPALSSLGSWHWTC